MPKMEKIRVSIQQPALPKFRIPFFKSLAEQKNIDLHLYYSINDPTLPNVEADGFKASYEPIYKFNILNKATILWHSPQWTSASSAESDVLVLSWDMHYLSLLPAMLRAKINKVPVILWGHGYSKKENKVRKYLRELPAKFASALVFYDYNTADAFIKSGFSKNKIFVAPNSIDQSFIKESILHWKNRKDDLTSFQKQLNINPARTIAYIGRIYAENRLDFLIEALSLLVKEKPDVKLVLIGKGGEEDAHLKELANSLKVSDYIIWVGAVYDEVEIAKWMLSSTLFCYPENIGLSILHAFGYGLPVITSDNLLAHNPEIYTFKDQENGLFFKSGSAENLAQTLNNILDQPEKIESLSNTAVKTVEEDFNISKMVAGFKSAIEFVFNSSRN